jgi:hypothetical protein
LVYNILRLTLDHKEVTLDVAGITQSNWYKRTDDEKFDSLENLHAFLKSRRERSRQVDISLSNLQFTSRAADDDDIGAIHLETHEGLRLNPSNWAFNQLCSTIGAHPTSLYDLPARINTEILNYRLGRKLLERDMPLGLMVVDNAEPWRGEPFLQGVTSQKYGRIWDEQLAAAALEIRDRTNGAFDSPLQWGKDKRALFAGDRDCHILLVNGGSIVDAGTTFNGQSDLLYRGFIMGNSEVRARAYYWATFLFRWVCGNFAIHGIEQVEFAKVVHTPSAPGRFVNEALPVLMKYVNASPKPLEEVIKRAKDTLLPKDLKKHVAYFSSRGFTQFETQKARMHALKEEGGTDTLWQMLNGFTASARKLANADARTDLETRAGKLLEQVA